METSFAVITGASSGIGLELAKQFGSHGFELLIASGSDEIFEAQRTLEDMGIEVEAMKVNLATYAGVENFYSRIQSYGKKLDAIAINTEVGAGGDFLETDLREEINLINLNIVSAVHLLKKVLPEMKLRGAGKVLITSSIVSQKLSPFEAIYVASKAFLCSFTASLRNELKDSGITFILCSNDPAEVARLGFEGLIEGRQKLFSEGLLTKLQGYALKILPDKARGQFHRIRSGPGSGNLEH